MITLQTLEPNEIAIITDRMKDELTARCFYECASAWCSSNGYDKAAKYYLNESAQEDSHYKKWLKYLSDWNVVIKIPAVDCPEFTSLIDVIEKQYIIEWDLLQAYQNCMPDVPKMCCDKTCLIVMDFVRIQNDSVIEANSLVTKAYNYQSIDPNLVLFEQENFN